MRKIKGLRWYMIGLVTIGTVLGYLTRNAIAVAAPTLEDTLHITTQQYSYIVAAYSACYTVMQPVAGYVWTCSAQGRLRHVRHSWAVFCMGTALANNWGGLARARRGRHGRGGDDPRRAEGQQRVVSGQRAFRSPSAISTSVRRSAACSPRRWWYGPSWRTAGRWRSSSPAC